MAKKILIIDHDVACQKILRDLLQERGYTVWAATTGREGMGQVYEHQPDLVILDVTVSGRDENGFEVCSHLREFTDIPILVLTERSSESDVVHAFDLGADDYVKKPFNCEEVFARIEALIRRRKNTTHPTANTKSLKRYFDGTLEIDFLEQRVLLQGEVIDLTPNEYKLLAFLASHPEEVFSQRALLMELWQDGHQRDKGLVSLYIHQLRQKLGDGEDREHKYIHTQWGQGYWFNPIEQKQKESPKVALDEEEIVSHESKRFTLAGKRWILWPVLIVLLSLVALRIGSVYGLLPNSDQQHASVAVAAGTWESTVERDTSLEAIVSSQGFAEGDEYGVRGEICVKNKGKNRTENLAIFNQIQIRRGDQEQYDDYVFAHIDCSKKSVLYPDELHCYPYEITFEPVSADDVIYQNMFSVSITNYTGWMPEGKHCNGTTPCPYGLQIADDFEIP